MPFTKRRTGSLKLVPPALATRVTTVPTGREWMHEAKLDGFRIQCHVSEGTAVLLTRNGLDWTDKFPRIQADAELIAGSRDMILDGEIVVPTRDGSSQFQALQRAVTDTKTAHALYMVFDMLTYDGMDLRSLPLIERRKALRALLSEASTQRHVKLTRERMGSPDGLLAEACRNGEEGIISKRRSACYPAGRSLDWLKIKCTHQDEFVVVGFTAPRGSREHIGALLLATRTKTGGVIQYAGRVGSGMDAAMLRTLLERLHVRDAAPKGFESKTPLPDRVQWVEPRLVVSAKFAEWTSDGLLRQATFGGIREDKTMPAVKRERVIETPAIEITHRDRIVYAETGVRKRDIAEYFEAVASMMLPHITSRPLSLLRCPGGAASACFFQKHWAARQGHKVRTRQVTESDGTTDPYAVALSSTDLQALVQNNALEIHAWGSKFPSIEKPDRIIFDLDPGPQVTWGDVCEAARAVREILKNAGLQSWLKLSGGKGLHVTVPLSGAVSWEQASLFSKLVATRMATDEPKRFTSTMTKRARGGRIFIDWMRNARGATAIAPWSLRARSGAPIAMPILWCELAGIPRGDLMSIGDVMDYLRSTPTDPWQDMLASKQRFTAAMVHAIGGSA